MDKTACGENNSLKIDVEAVAALAKLEFSSVEMISLEKDMNEIIAFADKLKTVEDVAENVSSHIFSLKNVLREDTVESNYTADELLTGAKTKSDGYITVPRVVEG